MSDVNLDLFGEPAIAPRGPGRPALVWTSEISQKISLLFACGHTEKDVAAAIGHCTKTLRRVFSKEWADRKIARLKLRGHQLYRLNLEAAKGNVTAEKALAALVQSEVIRATSNQLANRSAAASNPSTRAPTLGKKEAARMAAASAEGRFATRTPPPGLMN